MPFKIIKSSYDYCAKNKPFFAFILLLLFVCQCIIDFLHLKFSGSVIMSVLMIGYGLQVTQDVINDGARLPKVMPKNVIIFGIKGYVIFSFYLFVQAFLLVLVSVNLNFPTFDFEELFLNFFGVMHLFRVHDPLSFTVFIVSGIIIVFVTSFFMEISLARLADGGKLRKSFNFFRIKRAIDIIGWKSYSWDYTKIALSIAILTYLINYKIPITLADSVIDAVLSFLIFAIQYIGIGTVYKVYTDNKPD